MGNTSTYINYFRQLAVTHTAIKHDADSETGDSGIGKKRFACLGSNEIINGLPSKMGYPALFVEMYEVDTNAEIVHDVRQRCKGSFMVVDHSNNTFQDNLRAYDVSEAIVYQLLQKIWTDHYGTNADSCTRPFKKFSFNNLSITPTGKLYSNEYGYYVQFEFELQNSINISQPPADGIFN